MKYKLSFSYSTCRFKESSGAFWFYFTRLDDCFSSKFFQSSRKYAIEESCYFITYNTVEKCPVHLVIQYHNNHQTTPGIPERKSNFAWSGVGGGGGGNGMGYRFVKFVPSPKSLILLGMGSEDEGGGHVFCYLFLSQKNSKFQFHLWGRGHVFWNLFPSPKKTQIPIIRVFLWDIWWQSGVICTTFDIFPLPFVAVFITDLSPLRRLVRFIWSVMPKLYCGIIQTVIGLKLYNRDLLILLQIPWEQSLSRSETIASDRGMCKLVSFNSDTISHPHLLEINKLLIKVLPVFFSLSTVLHCTLKTMQCWIRL